MQFESTLFAIPHAVAFCVNIVFLAVLWRHRDRRGASGLILDTCGIIVLSVIVVLQVSSVGLQAKTFWWSFRFTPVSMMAISVLVVTLEYTNREQYLTLRNVTFLSIVPLFAQLVAVSERDTLIGTHSIDAATGLLTTTFGPVYYFWAGTMWLYVAVGVALLLGLFLSRPQFKKQSGLLVGTYLLVAVGWVLWILGVIPLDTLALTATVKIVGVYLAIGRLQLLDVVPVARQTAWNEMEDAVVTLDEADRVVDSNRAARELFDVDAEYTGMHAAEFFGPVPDSVLEQFRGVSETDTQLSVDIDGETRWFSVSISPVDVTEDSHRARVVALQEITSLKQREAELEAREQELDVLRQVQSRVLRHNIRTELSMVQGHAAFLADEDDEEEQRRLQRIEAASDRLSTISDKARVIEELFEEEQGPQEYDVRGCIDRAVANISQEYPELSVSVTGAEQCPVTASPHLQTAIENLLENAAVHTDRDTPQTDVHVENGSAKQLTISDNGPGIPDQELTVLQKESEDALEHGSGLGLWVVKWIVDRSNADLEFDTGADGTEVTIAFAS